MKLYIVAAIAGLSLMVQAAAPAHGPAQQPRVRAEPPPNVITPTYTTTGVVESVSNGFIRIDHAEVTELDWPAMTMTYEVRNPQMVANLPPGTPVRFSFRREGFSWVLMQVARQ